jgi:hypothetical protein
VGGMQRPHDKVERAVGFMVSTTTGKVGGDKRGKDNAEVPKYLLVSDIMLDII